MFSSLKHLHLIKNECAKFLHVEQVIKITCPKLTMTRKHIEFQFDFLQSFNFTSQQTDY
jgi:hypothetical protein